MRRLVALGIALCLCAPCLGHAEGKIQPYTFDRTDRQKIYESSGTGGTVPHTGNLWGVPSDEDCFTTNEPYVVPDSLRQPIMQWKRQALAAWGIAYDGDQDAAFASAGKAQSADVSVEQIPGRHLWVIDAQAYIADGEEYSFLMAAWKVQNALVFARLTAWGEEEEVEEAEEAEEDKRYIQTAIFDPVRGKQLVLSDFFYDGFNYIAYINSCLAHHQEETPYHDRQRLFALTEGDMRAPFSGLPNDYPLFAPVSGVRGVEYIEILYDSENPFWRQDTQNPISILVPLTPDISPYAVRDTWRVTLRHQRQELSGEQYALKPIITINEGEDVPRDDALNAALTRDWGNLLKRVQREGLLDDPDRWIESYSRICEDAYVIVYANIMMPGGDYDEGICVASPLINAYALATGEPLDAAAMLKHWQENGDVYYDIAEESEDEAAYEMDDEASYDADDEDWEESEDETEDEIEAMAIAYVGLDDYDMPKGTKVKGFANLWLDDTASSATFCIELTEPSGRSVWAWRFEDDL